MNKATSIVEINGNRYDAVSGQLVGAVKRAAYQAIKPTQGLSIDGFTRRAAKATVHATRSVHERRRRPEHSKTLMRSGVKKPARASSEDKIEPRSLSPDHARADRARRVPKSSKVQRFGITSFSRAAEVKTGEVIAPKIDKPARSAAAATATLPSLTADASHQRLERLLDYALAHADAHKKSLNDSARTNRRFFGRLPRWLAVTITIVVLVTAAGIMLWRSVPAASFKLAATRAHIDAQMPTPISGYKIGPISSSENAVTTTIRSATDSAKKYTVTEQASNQPSASLAAAATAGTSGGSSHVQTVQDQDKTYILSQDGSKSTAVCTKGANTVTVEGLDLSVDQLLAAAKNACNTI